METKWEEVDQECNWALVSVVDAVCDITLSKF